MDESTYYRAAIENGYGSLQKRVENDPSIARHFKNEIEERLSLNASQIRAKRWNFFKVPQTSPADYKEIFVNMSSNKQALAGIRHRNLDPSQPYLEVMPNWVLSSDADLEEIWDAALAHFTMFSPKYICLRLSPIHHVLQDATRSKIAGQHIVAALAEDITKSPRPQNYKAITLSPIVDTSFYTNYEKTYDDFHKNYPQLKQEVPVCSLEDMNAAISDGLIFSASINDEKIGLIAAKKKKLLGHDGIYLVEIVLEERFKRKGLAAAFQRKFIDIASDSHPKAWVWGTIDATNMSSLKTANRVGRNIVSTEYFFDF